MGFWVWVVRVQSVTWAAIVGCPCDRWGVVCLVVTPPCGYCLKASMTGLAQPVLPSGLRIKSAMTGWGGSREMFHLCLVMAKSWFIFLSCSVR